jgi:hypothetical protein
MKVKFYSLAYSLLVATQLATTGNAQIPSDNSAGSGAVYAMTNDAVDNRILVYSRNSNGLLTFQRSVSTHGRGSGGIIDPLESQGSVVLSEGGSFLYAANAGSGTITTPSGLFRPVWLSLVRPHPDFSYTADSTLAAHLSFGLGSMAPLAG